MNNFPRLAKYSDLHCLQQNTGSVGRAGAAPPTYKFGKFLSWPLALSMSTYSNFQINRASGETLKPPDPRYGIVGCFGNLSNIINFSFFEVNKTFLKSNFCISLVPNCA